MLVKAGLDPTIAFISDTAFKNTLLAIKDEGITYPLTMATSHTRMVLHTAASWVWEAGGDFITPDGRSTLVTTTESLAGFYQYFELSRFLTHETSRLNGEQSDMFFTQGKAAIAISGPWLLQQAADTPEERANIGVAPLPGVSFLGGSNLILWDQSINIQASMALIRFLTSKQFQSTYFNRAGYFPSRLDVLSSPLYSQNPWYHSLSGNLLKGRSFLPLRLWGNVEDGLSRAIHQTWNEIFDSPDTDYHAIVDRNLKLINHRLSMTLSSNR
jgi:multiple sugar transport system substrate-binding protein